MNTMEMPPLERPRLQAVGAPRLAALSHQGLIREDNQDSWRLDEHGHFAIVADGMGGHDGGALASATAADAATAVLSDHGPLESPRAEEVLVRAFEAAFTAVELASQADPELAGMGTTMVCAARVGQSELLVGHLGDSRLYRLREGVLTVLTEDHTVLSELIRAGVLTGALIAENRRLGHLLTRAISPGGAQRPDLFRVALAPGDRYLLCSDGLHGVVTDEHIARELGADDAPEDICQRLIEATLDAGAPDNVTVAILHFPA